MEQKMRLSNIDFMRGVGIWLMVAGHIGFGQYFDHFIHAFHMPLFYMISGYFSKDNSTETVRSFAARKARSLLIPYFSFGIFYCVIISLFRDNDSGIVNGIVESLSHLFFWNTDGIPIAGALWFLTSLYITDIIYFTINKILNRTSSFYCDIFCLAVGFLATVFPPILLPWSISPSLVGLGLYAIGHQFKRVESAISIMLRKFNFLATPFFLIIICISILSPAVNMRISRYPIPVFFWLNASLCVLSLYWFTTIVYDLRNSSLNSIQHACEWVGAHSLPYVCANQVSIAIVLKILRILLFDFSYSILFFALCKVLTLLVVMFLLRFFAILSDYRPLSLMYGKRNRLC